MNPLLGSSRVAGGGHRDRPRPPASFRCEVGSATAEFAISLIALVAVLVPLLSGIEYAARQAQAQEVARAAARQLARGDDSATVVTQARSALSGVMLQSWSDAGMTRVRVSAEVRLLMGLQVPVSADAVTITEVNP